MPSDEDYKYASLNRRCKVSNYKSNIQIRPPDPMQRESEAEVSDSRGGSDRKGDAARNANPYIQLFGEEPICGSDRQSGEQAHKKMVADRQEFGINNICYSSRSAENSSCQILHTTKLLML